MGHPIKMHAGHLLKAQTWHKQGKTRSHRDYDMNTCRDENAEIRKASHNISAIIMISSPAVK